MGRPTDGSIDKGVFRVKTPLNAVTDTTTSSAIPIGGAKRITWFFTRADHSSGSSAFKTQVSADGVNFFDFNGLIEDQTNSNSQTKARATTITLSSNGTTIASMDLEHHNFAEVRAVVTETTDGTHTAQCVISYD